MLYNVGVHGLSNSCFPFITPSVSEGTAAVKQESIPWQSFVFDAAWSSRFETPRSALVPQAFLPVFFRGWAVAIF
jgi:hypothetical protein